MFQKLMATRRRLKVFKAFMSLVDDPAKTDRVFVLSDSLRQAKSPLFETVVKHISEMPGVMDLYKERYNPQIPPLSELAKYPEGSFGREFANHMLKNGLEIEFYPHLDTSEFIYFALERGRKSHDLWHVLTGFNTNVADEVGLQAFGLAQLKAPFPALLVAGGILHAITKNPAIFGETIEKIFYGYQLGLRAKPLLGVKWEEELYTDLFVLRSSLGLVAPVPQEKSRLVFQGA